MTIWLGTHRWMHVPIDHIFLTEEQSFEPEALLWMKGCCPAYFDVHVSEPAIVTGHRGRSRIKRTRGGSWVNDAYPVVLS